MMEMFGSRPDAGAVRPAAARSNGTVAISTIRLPVILGICALALTFAYAASKIVTDCGACAEIETFVHLDREANLPTWFSSTIWLIAGGLALLVSLARSSGPRDLAIYWRAMAAVCVFLSLDEASMFHETFGNMLGGAVSAGEVLFYNWLFYGIVAVLAVALAFIPFIRALPRETALRIVLAGAIFVSGAIGAEFLGGASRAGAIDLIQGRVMWGIELMVEEFLEMLGVIVLIHALLHHLSLTGRSVSISVR